MTTSTAQPGFHEAEIRETLHSLVATLEDEDLKKRAYAYTEDATFVMFGTAPVHGREEMLRRLETGTPLSSIKITPHTIEGDGRLAYVYGDFACLAGPTHTSPGTPTSLYFLMVLRKEADGAWRIAREFLCPVPRPSNSTNNA
jgi:ketosteroid isomerase-like protein